MKKSLAVINELIDAGYGGFPRERDHNREKCINEIMNWPDFRYQEAVQQMRRKSTVGELTVKVSADMNDFKRQCRIIGKHLTDMAEELDSIGATGGVLPKNS